MDGPRGAASTVGRGVGKEVDQRLRAPDGYAAHDARARPLPGGEAVGVPVPSGFPPIQRQLLNIAHYRIIPAITRAMPEHVREGFRSIMARRGLPGSATRDPDRERKADAAARWMHENGVPMGFRAPRASERARAFGMGRYLADLGLTEKELFDATGNMFDKDALLVRVGCPIKRWVSGEPVPTKSTPTPTQVGIEYEALRGSSTAASARPRLAPVPADMPNLLGEMEGWDLRKDARHRDAPEMPARSAHFHGSGRGAHGRGRTTATRSGTRTRAGPTGGAGPDVGHDLAGALGIGGVRPPRRGAAGGPARVGQGNYCVMDSLAQVLDGAPRACIDPGAERRAEEATGEARRLCRIEGAGIVPTVAAWIWAVAERYAPGDPRPIFVELGTAGGGVGGADDHSTQVIVFAGSRLITYCAPLGGTAGARDVRAKAPGPGRSASRSTTLGTKGNGPRTAPHPGASTCQLGGGWPNGWARQF